MTRLSDPPEGLASNLTEERHLKDLENALQAAARSVLSRVPEEAGANPGRD